MAKTDDKADPKADPKQDLLGGRRLVAKHRVVFPDRTVEPGEGFECDAKEGDRLVRVGAAEDEAPRRKAKKGDEGA